MVSEWLSEEVEVNLPGLAIVLRVYDRFLAGALGHHVALLHLWKFADCAGGIPADFGL